eukprot:GILK01002653.1.p1 GENE.GILK01002653.1~~GILK01002653.1.p1  ORF type:complete len:285 (+),score=32.74 GILK01002653.1:76-930(+)
MFLWRCVCFSLVVCLMAGKPTCEIPEHKTSTSAETIFAKSISVLCFGDSWTDGNAAGLQEVLRSRGHQNVKLAKEDYWGFTADYFAKNHHIFPQVAHEHKPDYVVLSLGGNDYKNVYWKQRKLVAPWTVVREVKQSLKTVLDAFYAQHPNVKIVMYGYDFPGNVESHLNRVVDGRPLSLLQWAYNLVGVRIVNHSAMLLGEAYRELELEFKQRGHSLTYVPLWGTLQRAEALAKGEKPNFQYRLSQPSPNLYMRDPIHASTKGYVELMGSLYDKFFAREFVPQA